MVGMGCGNERQIIRENRKSPNFQLFQGNGYRQINGCVSRAKAKGEPCEGEAGLATSGAAEGKTVSSFRGIPDVRQRRLVK